MRIYSALAVTAFSISEKALPDLPGRLRRNAARIGVNRVPDVALFATLKRLRPPRLDDGFDRILEVQFDGCGRFEVHPCLLTTVDQGAGSLS